MNQLKLGGRIEDKILNKHIVSVIKPKYKVSYEEGSKKIDELISKIKKKK